MTGRCFEEDGGRGRGPIRHSCRGEERAERGGVINRLAVAKEAMTVWL